MQVQATTKEAGVRPQPNIFDVTDEIWDQDDGLLVRPTKSPTDGQSGRQPERAARGEREPDRSRRAETSQTSRAATVDKSNSRVARGQAVLLISALVAGTFVVGTGSLAPHGAPPSAKTISPPRLNPAPASVASADAKHPSSRGAVRHRRSAAVSSARTPHRPAPGSGRPAVARQAPTLVPARALPDAERADTGHEFSFER
jgi:hypothetical protein